MDACYHCRLEQHHPGGTFALPQWMFDPGVCAKARLAEEPVVDWLALKALKQLLEDSASPGMVQQRHQPRRKGDADVATTIACEPGAVEVLSASFQSSRLDDIAGGSSAGGDAPADEVLTECRSRKTQPADGEEVSDE